MPAVTVDPLHPEALEGLKDPNALLRAFNRLQEECAILNGALTAANFSRLVLTEKELVTPSEWVPLTLDSGFVEADSGIYPVTAVRKRADGVVELRENVKRTTGSPTAFSPIAALPPAYAPAFPVLRVASASSGAAGLWKVVGQEVQWVSGDPTSQFAFAGGSWLATDRSMPAWEKPFRVTLPVQNLVSVRKVLVVARKAAFDGYGLTTECTVYGATVERVEGQPQPVLSMPRIDGLQPETRYKLALWVFLD